MLTTLALLSLTVIVLISFTGLGSSLVLPHRISSNYQNNNQLSQSSFDLSQKGFFHSGQDAQRYETYESWRDADSFEPTFMKSPNRPPMPEVSEFRSKGEYLKTPIVADYAPGAEKIFFMIKTGATVLWRRLPVHLFTSLTRVPNFALYSDMAGSIGGYEVIDVFENLTQSTLKSEKFEMYRRQKWVHDNHGVIDASETTLLDGWELDKFKNIPMLAHAYSVSPDSDWYVFMDADSYFMVDNLVKYLKTLNPNEALYMGSTAAYGDLLFAHGGSGVVLSHKAIKDTIGTHPEYVEEYENKTFDVCCGDVMVALMLREKLGIEISRGYDYPTVGYKFQGNSFWDLEITGEKWCQPILSFHHLTPHDIEILWEYEKLKGPKKPVITWGMLYHDFYQPYISEQHLDWDNRARDKEYTYSKDKAENKKQKSEGGGIQRPYESFTACQIACYEDEDCLSFRYLPKEKYCGTSKAIRLGRPTHEWVKQLDSKDMTGAISGWNIEKIREMRSTIQCDPLYEDKSAEGMADGSKNDRIEGWYSRMRVNQDRSSDRLN